MIVKNFELKNFINKKKLFLIYGENEGLKEDLILEFAKGYSKENIFKYFISNRRNPFRTFIIKIRA